jgi:hypothetical protein
VNKKSSIRVGQRADRGSQTDPKLRQYYLDREALAEIAGISIVIIFGPLLLLG